MPKRSINDLTPAERREFMRSEYARISRFNTMFASEKVEIECAKHTEALRDEITRLLIQKRLIAEPLPLEELHTQFNDNLRAYNFNDGVNKISTHFYETDERFQAIYLRFVREVLHDGIFKIPMYFQETPTIRIHCPNAANSNHYPRYHTDIGYGHPPEEINVWLPLTELRTEHRFRVMNLENSKRTFERFDFDVPSFVDSAIHDPDFNRECGLLADAVETPLGKALLFDSRCIHSGEPMIENTRVSIDMRVVPVADYENAKFEFQGTGRRRILFAPGHCYSNQSTESLAPKQL